MMVIKAGKNGAKVNGMQTEILLAFVIASEVFSAYKQNCVLTECTGSKHSSGSLHYVGYAIDLRTRNMSQGVTKTVVSKIKATLGNQYDVVLESDHIHIEFQPKD